MVYSLVLVVSLRALLPQLPATRRRGDLRKRWCLSVDSVNVRGMKTSRKVLAWAGAAVLVVAASVSIAAIANPATPEPKSAPTNVVHPLDGEAFLGPEIQVTSEPEPPVEVAPPAPVVEAPVVVQPAPPPAPPAPIRCPPGSSPNSNDGVNDTSCFPTKCFTMVVDPADPAAADCLVAFKP